MLLSQSFTMDRDHHSGDSDHHSGQGDRLSDIRPQSGGLQTGMGGRLRPENAAEMDEAFVSQGFTFPLASVQVQHETCLGLEIGIAREDPGAVNSKAGWRRRKTIAESWCRNSRRRGRGGTPQRDIWDMQPRQRPRRYGSSHAIALTSTTTSGGNNRGTSMPWTLLEPGESLFKESLAPLRHDLPARIQACGNLIVVVSLGSEKDDLGSNHISIW